MAVAFQGITVFDVQRTYMRLTFRPGTFFTFNLLFSFLSGSQTLRNVFGFLFFCFSLAACAGGVHVC